MATRDERMDIVELGIDGRLADVRELMFHQWVNEGDTIEVVAALLRVAYAKGLHDAVKDPTKTRRFLREHGFKVPRVSSH